jgi:hypothetical protein
MTIAIFLIASSFCKSNIYVFGHCLNIFEMALCTIFWFLSPLLLNVSCAISAPNQRLGACVVEIDDQSRLDVLLWGNSAHSSADAAHAPRAIGGLLSHAAVGSKDQVRLL